MSSKFIIIRLAIPLSFVFSLFFCPMVRGQSISYLYPAGGKQGTSVEVLLAGLGGIERGSQIWFSGEGVSATILYRSTQGEFLFQTPFGNKCRTILNDILNDEAKLLPLKEQSRQLEETRQKLQSERRQRYDKIPIKEDDIPMPTDDAVFKAFPYAHRLKSPTIEDLQRIYYEYFAFQFDRRINRLSRETLTLEVNIDPDAKPGLREVRVLATRGLSRVGYFFVGTANEVLEIEPNEIPIWDAWSKKVPVTAELSPQKLPVVFNGQIRPGDIDRFYFHAKRNQRLVIDVQARSLEPFIANAVPGWFAAVATLYGPDGSRLKYSDSYRFDQNPLLLHKTTQAGIYCVEIQDSIFRGRNDFVYRVSVGELPIVNAFFPLGGPVDKPLHLFLSSGNTKETSAPVDTSGPVAYEEVRIVDMIGDDPLVRPFHYVLETLPIFSVPPKPQVSHPLVELNDPFQLVRSTYSDIGTDWPFETVIPAQSLTVVPPVPIPFPCVIYDAIDFPGEIDEWEFIGKAGDSVVIDVLAQALGSALDAVVELRDSSHQLIGENDDRADATGDNLGIRTHHSDPHLQCTLPKEGKYTVRVFNRFNRGGTSYYYRIRISPPQPDFTVCVQPSAINLNGNNASFRVKVIRHEGWDGEIKLTLPNEMANKVVLSGNSVIRPDENTKNFSLRVTKKPTEKIIPLELIATGNTPNRTISHPVIPVDDWEQAFIYHHLVPTQTLLMFERGSDPTAKK